MRIGRRAAAVFVVLCAWGAAETRAQGGESFAVFPSAGNQIQIYRGEECYLELFLHGWGPGFQPYLGFKGEAKADGPVLQQRTEVAIRASGTRLELNGAMKQTGPRSLDYELALTTGKDVKLLAVVLAVRSHSPFEGGRAVAVTADGEQEQPLPLNKKGFAGKVRELRLIDKAGRTTRLRFEPATRVTSDDEARVAIASDELAAGAEARLKVSFDLPAQATLYPEAAQAPTPDLSAWFPFAATADMSRPSEFDMTAWLDGPAGKHGRIVRRGGDLIYNGKPIRLWGINACYNSCAPVKEMADQRAAFYARYGINAVRFHKFADGVKSQGILAGDSFLNFDAEALARMDYFVSALKNRGLYVKLSPNFGVQLWPKDLERVPFAKELGAPDGGVIDTGNGSIYLSREVQDLQIEQMVKVLKHLNPHTGLTYALDPAIAVIEIINEESVLFGGAQDCLKKVPTLRQRTSERFFQWLKARYGTQEKLMAAWGQESWNSFEYEKLTGDDWESGRIVPAGCHPWYLDPAQLAGSQAFRRQRLLDTMRFMVELQDEFYARYVQAIRAAGYEGEILASNWQAGRAYSHYANLHSDYRVGLIDRHNYFGGSRAGRIDTASMLAVPGSGSLSAGMQQVEDRPFMLSEWIHCAPNEWGVEGPAIIGAYGMGLQGWDVSFLFQNRDTGRFVELIYDDTRDVWQALAPQVLGVFPAVSRQVLRGDVTEAGDVAVRNVHAPSLFEGRLAFEDRVQQVLDVKTFDSDKVPAVSLAAARCVVRFTTAYEETPAFDLAPYRQGPALAASTRQLTWHAGANATDGCFTMDTPGTKAVVGFAKGRECALGDVSITPGGRYAALYITAHGPAETLATARKLLVVAIARARNTGMRIYADEVILSRGSTPILMEPVKATIRLGRKGSPTVRLLDHDGARTEKTLPVADGAFTIDGARDKTCYYLVEY
jgi:hypothetical protein